MTTEHKAIVQELTKELKDLKNAIEEQRQQVQKETEQKSDVQERLKEAEKYIEELKAKNTELENSRPNPGTRQEFAISTEIKLNFGCNQVKSMDILFIRVTNRKRDGLMGGVAIY